MKEKHLLGHAFVKDWALTWKNYTLTLELAWTLWTIIGRSSTPI
jgi:hypothetical protein